MSYIKKTQFVPPGAWLKLFSSVPEESFVLEKFSNAWRIISYSRWGGKKKGRGSGWLTCEGSRKSSQQSRHGPHRDFVAWREAVPCHFVWGRQEELQLCSSQPPLPGSKNDASGCAGGWAHNSSGFSKNIEVVISVLLLGDRWPLKPVVIAMYWLGICDQYCLYGENFKYKLHRISVWEDKGSVWQRATSTSQEHLDQLESYIGDGDMASARSVPKHWAEPHCAGKKRPWKPLSATFGHLFPQWVWLQCLLPAGLIPGPAGTGDRLQAGSGRW